MVTYTVYSDQGTPDVYVDGVYAGKISNGSLTYSHLPYESDVTVTLENCSSKSNEESLTDFYGRFTPYWDDDKTPVIFRSETTLSDGQFLRVNSSNEFGVILEYPIDIYFVSSYTTTSYNNVLSSTLSLGSNSVTIDYSVSQSSRNVEIRSTSSYQTIDGTATRSDRVNGSLVLSNRSNDSDGVILSGSYGVSGISTVISTDSYNGLSYTFSGRVMCSAY